MSQQDALAGLKILVVEDNLLIAEHLVGILERHGGQLVGPVPRLAAALGLLAGKPELDGAVLDVNLDGENCTLVAAALVSRGVPFVFLTGYDTRTILSAEFASVPVLSKPIEEDELIALISRRFRAE